MLIHANKAFIHPFRQSCRIAPDEAVLSRRKLARKEMRDLHAEEIYDGDIGVTARSLREGDGGGFGEGVGNRITSGTEFQPQCEHRGS